ncbi:MAG: thioredoxin family protein [Desulfobacteraceae bacterium]|jgi:FKBP-type peptidyl-prolyl cis-trans isomerase 2
MHPKSFPFKPKLVNHLARLSLFLALPAFLSCAHGGSPAGPPIQRGEPVQVHYTCRIQDGPLVTTTLEEVAEGIAGDPDASRLFLPRRTYGPEELVAGEPPEGPFDERLRKQPAFMLKGLHTVIREALAEAVVGRPTGDAFSVDVTAEYQDEVPDRERVISLRRAFNFPKTQRLSRDEFMARTGAGRPPFVGMSLNMVQGMDCEVISITEDEVVVEFTPRQQGPIQTPFGEKDLIDQGDRWVTRIQTEPGHLVRTGPQIGRISEVQGGMFLIDYGHPFGGRTLECVVTADLMPSSPVTSASVRPSDDTGPAEEEKTPAKNVQSTATDTAPPDLQHTHQEPEVQESPSADKKESAEDLAGVVEIGDLVEIDYIAAFTDGALLHTTLPGVADDPDRLKVEGFYRPATLGPELIKAGESTVVPGLANNVLGMHPGQSRRVTLPPQRTFGIRAPSQVKEYDAVKTFPRRASLTPKEWRKQVKGFPVEGETYPLNPYVLARVTGVSASGVSVQLTPRSETVEDELGSTTVREKGDFIEVALLPRMGIPYQVEGRQGRVVAADERTFTVDFNHPFAGRSLMLDLEVVSLTKASELDGKRLAWIEDYDQGLSEAMERRKPMFLVLYADWCGYSKKLLNHTLQDPRIRLLAEEFVWVKVDSHKQQDLKELYEQNGYPMMVVLNPEGDILKTIQGYKDAAFLYQELKEFAGGNTLSVGDPGAEG